MMKEMFRMTADNARRSQPMILQASISRVRSGGWYDVRLANGGVVTGVSGPDGLKPGAMVVVSGTGGQNRRWMVISTGGERTAGIKDVRV